MRQSVVGASRDQLDTLALPMGDACLVQAAESDEFHCTRRRGRGGGRALRRLDVLVQQRRLHQARRLPDAVGSGRADGFGLKFFGAMRCSRPPGRICRPPAAPSSPSSASAAGPQPRSRDWRRRQRRAPHLTKVLADRGVKYVCACKANQPRGIATDRLQTRIRAWPPSTNLDLPEAEQRWRRSTGRRPFRSARDRPARRLSRLSAAAFCQGSMQSDADCGQTRTRDSD